MFKQDSVLDVRRFLWLDLNKYNSKDFPGGSVVRNPPPNAGDVGSTPGQGTKTPHAVGQLSPHSITEPKCSGACVQQLRPNAAK